jgi:hypothetical protein
MKRSASIATALLFAPSVASAQFAASQQVWESELNQRCPSRHVEWIPDGSYDDVIAAYDAGLSPNLQREARRIADYSHRCSHEVAGSSCEWAAYIDAYWRLGSGLVDQGQKMTAAAMAMAEKKKWAHRS